MDFFFCRAWISRCLKATLPVFICSMVSFTAHAQATRTWVSGVGDDANPCSRTAPCKTFAGAISKTAAGGEIDALDPGGYGAVTITKAITLDGAAGQVASVLVSGTNGIILNAGVSDDVILRNLSINGVGTGLDGIKLLGGRSLRIQNVRVDRFTQNCINISPGTATSTVQIVDSVATNCANGLSVTSTATATPPPWAATVSVERSRFLLNKTAGETGVGVLANGSNALIQLSNSTVFGNDLGISATNQSSIVSFGNNQTQGNTNNGAFTGTASSN